MWSRSALPKSSTIFRTQFVASFLGSANLLKVKVLEAQANTPGEGGVKCFAYKVKTPWDGVFSALRARIPLRSIRRRQPPFGLKA